MQPPFTLPAADGHAIPVHAWLPPAGAPVRAVLQVAHGMGEHALRYARLAEELAARGIAVYANDHRGHGEAARDPARRGDLGAGGFAALVDDLAVLARRLRECHPGVPLVLLGHSMGSFAAQVFALDHAALLDGLALSGTAATDLLMATSGPQRRLEDYAGAGARTPFDWLSRDAAEVDKYLADPLCGFSLTKGSRASMVATCQRTAAPGAFRAAPAHLPVYLFVGDADPVNHGLAWFHPLVQRLREAGLTDVTARVYAGARHELLNETNRAEVTADFVAWLEHSVISGAGGDLA